MPGDARKSVYMCTEAPLFTHARNRENRESVHSTFFTFPAVCFPSLRDNKVVYRCGFLNPEAYARIFKFGRRLIFKNIPTTRGSHAFRIFLRYIFLNDQNTDG